MNPDGTGGILFINGCRILSEVHIAALDSRLRGNDVLSVFSYTVVMA